MIVLEILCVLLGLSSFVHGFADPVIPNMFGVNVHWTSPLPGEMTMLSASGFKFLRMGLHWSVIETQKGIYNFTDYDIFVATLDKYGMKASLTFDFTNPLYDGGMSPCSEEGRKAFAAYATAGVKRYQGKGYFWEMYNEPNNAFWKPAPNVTDYTLLALTVGASLKASVPSETFMGPCTSGFDWDFIESTFKGGVLKYFDCVSIHPYRGTYPETATPDYQKLRQLVNQYSPGKNIPIVSSEWGYASSFPTIGMSMQAQYVVRILLNNLASGVNFSVIYDWHDDGTNATYSEDNFGTVYFPYYPNQTNVFDPKPAYLAVKTLTTYLAGYEFDNQVHQNWPDDFVLNFHNKFSGANAFAVWTTETTNHTIEFNLPVAKEACYHVIEMYGNENGKLCSATSGLLTVNASCNVVYLLPM